MVARLWSLGVELCLGAALLVAFGALLTHGSRAGRVAFRAMVWGSWAALLAALGTMATQVDAVWLMEAWRVDLASQALKAAIVAALLVTVRVTRHSTDEWTAVRAVGPFFRLACAAGLVAAASAGDLVVLWLAFDLASVALILAVAVGGPWATREHSVRRMVQAWLPSSLLLLLGVTLMAAVAGATRFVDLETVLPEFRARPMVLLSLALMLGSILVRALRFVAVLLPAPRPVPSNPTR